MSDSASDHRRQLLLLAGSGEARDIAAALARRDDWSVKASLLFPERSTGPLPVPTRFGRFGGEDGLARFLIAERIDAVLDATHPFANQISGHVTRVCCRLALPCAQVLRPPWIAGPGDQWTEVADERDVAALLVPGQKIFTTTGRATLDRLVARCQAQFFVRQLEEREDAVPHAHLKFVSERGPFSVEQETNTFRNLGIDVLVCKNSGGDTSYTKLQAARDLGLPVILIRRPAQPEMLKLDSVNAALNWVDGL